MAHQVVLGWTAVSGADSYNVYRGATSGAETQYAAGVTTNSFTDSNPPVGAPTFYQVTAVEGGLESARSNEVSVTVPTVPAPTGLTVESFS